MLLDFLDFDGDVTRFFICDKYAILSVFDDGCCFLESWINSDKPFSISFNSFNEAFSYILDIAYGLDTRKGVSNV